MSKPLARIRVLDLSRLLPGPMATRHLADLGADVLRIDGASDEFAIPQELDLLLNRNKRSMRIDLKVPEGRETFLNLAKAADVVIESFRPGVVDRLGIGYEAVRRENPRIVYCSISGYGQTGPDRLRSGHDINYLAFSGVAGNPPVLPNLQIGDLLGGSLTAVMGILAALVDVQAGGPGRYIDVSMTDSLLAHSVVALAGLNEALTGALPCYNYYRTADGRYLAIGALEPKFWERLCDAVSRPDLKPCQYVTQARDELQAIFASQTLAHWEEQLRDVDCCVTPVLTLAEALERRPRPGSPLKIST